MQLRPGGSRLTPIGLEVGDRALRAVQLRRSADGCRIVASAVLRRVDRGPLLSSLDAERLLGVLRRQGFAWEEAVLATPRKMVMTADLSFEEAPGVEAIEESVREEFERRLKRSDDDVELAWWETPGSSRGGSAVRIAAVACGHRDAEAILDVLDGCGLSISAMDTPAFALSRWLSHCVRRSDLRLAVDLDWADSHLVFAEGELVVYERLLPDLGVSSALAPLARQWQIDTDDVEGTLLELDGAHDANAPPCWLHDAAESVLARCMKSIADEVETSMGYIRHHYPDAPSPRLVLVGEGSRSAAVLRHLPKGLKAPFESVGEERPVGVADGDRVNDRPDLAVASGLALYEG